MEELGEAERKRVKGRVQILNTNIYQFSMMNIFIIYWKHIQNLKNLIQNKIKYAGMRILLWNMENFDGF